MNSETNNLHSFQARGVDPHPVVECTGEEMRSTPLPRRLQKVLKSGERKFQY